MVKLRNSYYKKISFFATRPVRFTNQIPAKNILHFNRLNPKKFRLIKRIFLKCFILGIPSQSIWFVGNLFYF